MKFEIIDKENLLKYEGKTADIERKIDESEDRLKEKEEALRNIIQKINAGKTVPEDCIESCFTVKLIKEFCKQEGSEENKLLDFSRKIDCLNHEVHESLNEDDGKDHSIEQELEDRNNLIHQYGELFALVLRDLNPETQYDKRVRLNLDYPLIDLMNFCASLSEKNDHDTEKSEEIPDCNPENDFNSAEKKGDMKKNSSDEVEKDNNSPAAYIDSAQKSGNCADVLFVLDASGSMRPCFKKLCDNISRFIEPFKEKGFESLRLGLLAYSAIKNRSVDPKYKYFYRNNFLCPDNKKNMALLYGDESVSGSKFFVEATTENGIKSFCDRLKQIKCRGDEDTPFALDCAGDFPFKPLNTTRRCIILFTDEPMDDGVAKMESLGENCEILDQVIRKIVARHISLYYFGPQCRGVDFISESPKVIVRNIENKKSDSEKSGIWDSLDFSDILDKLGQTISSSVLSTGMEPAFKEAVYGQDRWDEDAWWLL